MRPYSLNIFEIRKHYRHIFPEKEFEPLDFTNELEDKNLKLNKVKYTVIFLPVIGTHYHSKVCPYSHMQKDEFLKQDLFTTGLFSESEEIEIFGSKNVQNFIDFKWDSYAFKFHSVSTVI